MVIGFRYHLKSNMKFSRTWWAALVCTLCLSLPLGAQITTSVVSGRIVGPNGEGLAGVQVVATLPSTGERYGAMSRDDGK